MSFAEQIVAGVAELADAQASGACGSNIVWVQVPSPARKERAVANSNSSFPVFKISSAQAERSRLWRYITVKFSCVLFFGTVLGSFVKFCGFLRKNKGNGEFVRNISL